MSIVTFRPRMSSTVAATRVWRTGRRPSSTSTVTASPGATPRIRASAAVTHEALGGDLDAAERARDEPAQLPGRLDAHDLDPARAVAGDQAHRHGAERLDGAHAGQVGQIVQHGGGARLAQDHRHVLALGLAELDLHHPVDDVAEIARQHEDPHRERDAERREQRLGRAAPDVARDHQHRRREQAGDARCARGARGSSAAATRGASPRPAASARRAGPRRSRRRGPRRR